MALNCWELYRRSNFGSTAPVTLLGDVTCSHHMLIITVVRPPVDACPICVPSGHSLPPPSFHPSPTFLFFQVDPAGVVSIKSLRKAMGVTLDGCVPDPSPSTDS